MIPSAVRVTGSPAIDATSEPEYCAPAGTWAGSAVRVTDRLSPAGIVSWSASIASTPAGASTESGSTPPPDPGVVSPSVAARSSTTSASPRLVNSIVRSTGSGDSPHESMPKSPEPAAMTGASSAWSMSTTPEPAW